MSHGDAWFRGRRRRDTPATTTTRRCYGGNDVPNFDFTIATSAALTAPLRVGSFRIPHLKIRPVLLQMVYSIRRTAQLAPWNYFRTGLLAAALTDVTLGPSPLATDGTNVATMNFLVTYRWM